MYHKKPHFCYSYKEDVLKPKVGLLEYCFPGMGHLVISILHNKNLLRSHLQYMIEGCATSLHFSLTCLQEPIAFTPSFTFAWNFPKIDRYAHKSVSPLWPPSHICYFYLQWSPLPTPVDTFLQSQGTIPSAAVPAVHGTVWLSSSWQSCLCSKVGIMLFYSIRVCTLLYNLLS